MRRMARQWRDGRLYGRWYWETYDRDYGWAEEPWSKVNCYWRDMGDAVHEVSSELNASENVPQEILLRLLGEFDWVRAVVSGIPWSSPSDLILRNHPCSALASTSNP